MMDNQLPSPNAPGSAERPTGVQPEKMQPGPVPATEKAPMPGAGPSQSAPAQAAQPAKLSAADVAAAIASTPAVGTGPVVGGTPAVADDVDVIEPEWVAKAEEVVAQHQGDPYGEEEAIEDLQQDYMQKRYGMKIADPNPGDTKPKGS